MDFGYHFASEPWNVSTDVPLPKSPVDTIMHKATVALLSSPVIQLSCILTPQSPTDTPMHIATHQSTPTPSEPADSIMLSPERPASTAT
jgi:hypothetical protein